MPGQEAMSLDETVRVGRFARLIVFLRENGRYVVSVLASVVLTIVLLLLPWDYEVLRNYDRYGYLGIFIMTMLSSATVILPSPTLVAAWVGGAFLNPWLVGLVAGLGATVGELTGYMAGYGGSAMVARSRHYERIQRMVARYGLPVVFFFALIPNPLFDLTGIAAGTARMPLWKFMAVCLLGKSTRFVLIAYMGALWNS